MAEKKVVNPLLNVSITGGTLEDFTQNALLLPAKEISPAPVATLQLSQVSNEDLSTVQQNVWPKPEQPNTPFSQFANQNYYASDNAIISHQFEPVKFHNQKQSSDDTFHSLSTVDLTENSVINSATKTTSVQSHSISPDQNLHTQQKSVLSSFSSILGFKGSALKEEEAVDATPAPVGGSINQDNTNVQPVPLFSPSEVNILGKTPVSLPLQTLGTVNTYRRSGLKRPVYAQIPGLSSTSTRPSVLAEQSSANYFAPPSSFTHINPSSQLPSSSAVPLPAPNSLNQPLYISSDLTPNVQPPAQQPSVIHPSPHLTPPSASSLVMASIPPNELINDNIPSSISVEDTSNGYLNIEQISSPTANLTYRPVFHHWFYQKEVEAKASWKPFSMIDSLALEEGFTSIELSPDLTIRTDGGRCDVHILRRQRSPVYWPGPPTEVRRCSWFHKGGADGRLVPYEENVAAHLEEEYRAAFDAGVWHRKVALGTGETVVFHSPDVLVLFPASQSPDAWGDRPNQSRPRIVKRGLSEFDIDEGESSQVDHLLFLVHGIGAVCDLKFRTVEEVVEELRTIALQLVRSHYRTACEQGKASRVEILPIGWHDALHSEETDAKLKSITLESMPKLRHFTNDTILDVLFYTSPMYCQRIVQAVGNEMNRIYELFKERNPSFNGGVSLGGHSLGSLILFDILCHQHPAADKEIITQAKDEDTILPLNGPKPPPTQRIMSRRISYMMSSGGTGQPEIQYPHLNFEPKAFFALGSPIGMFVTVRGLDTLGEHFALPTCPAFFNIFHPYDPIAYRMESLINSKLDNLKPVLIPHHKGRKRMHLELKETMTRVGADLKQRVIDSVKSTLNSFYQFTMFHKPEQQNLEDEVNKVLKEQLSIDESTQQEQEQQQTTDIPLGILNKGRRIDYVLQEAPLEFIINEYLFALTSHVCYWESEDTMLLILKEIYSNLGVSPNSQIPQQTMTIERSKTPSPQPARAAESRILEPVQTEVNIGPPPKSGFIYKGDL